MLICSFICYICVFLFLLLRMNAWSLFFLLWLFVDWNVGTKEYMYGSSSAAKFPVLGNIFLHKSSLFILQQYLLRNKKKEMFSCNYECSHHLLLFFFFFSFQNHSSNWRLLIQRGLGQNDSTVISIEVWGLTWQRGHLPWESLDRCKQSTPLSESCPWCSWSNLSLSQLHRTPWPAAHIQGWLSTVL